MYPFVSCKNNVYTWKSHHFQGLDLAENKRGATERNSQGTGKRFTSVSIKRLEGCVEIFEGSVRTYRLTPSDAHARSVFFRDPSSRPVAPRPSYACVRACETTRTR